MDFEEAHFLGIKSIDKGEKYRILIIDDVKTIRGILKQILISERFEIYEASDGLEAVKLVRDIKIRPDIIISDIEMPVMDGITAIKNIKEIVPDVKVLMSSALSDTKSVVDSVYLGIKGYLVKPFTRKDILSKIALILGRKDYFK